MFGWQPKSVDEGPVVTVNCRHCAESVPWHLHSVTMWISLFFVKVLPTGAEYWLRCNGCGDGLPLSADQNALIRKGNPDDDPTIIRWIEQYQDGSFDPGGPPSSPPPDSISDRD